MVAPRYGASDPDIRKGSKETRDKAMLKASAVVPTTGMIGGISNRTTSPTARKSGPKGTLNFAKGGMVPACVEGGFRNAAMEHKRR